MVPNDRGQPSFEFDGLRRQSTSPFKGLTQAYLLLHMRTDATGEGGSCFGDSGGPKFFEPVPGKLSNLALAVTSGGDPVCRAHSVNQRLDIPSVRTFLDDGAPTAAPAFPTRNGTRQDPDNVRSRLLPRLRQRANELLETRGYRKIGHLTPHTLRRTFASLLAEVGVPPRRAMYLIGHTDPTLTMRVYQQVMDMGGGGPEALERVLGCPPDEACATWCERPVSGLKADSAGKSVRHRF
jgi:Phage integrase family